ncbi:MAG: Multi-sensor signal transduction histidine kinase [Pedosphaera sp.]|nr:Multi-sensor signal transduction histidine kinase [Pedosphaera sp.]
MDPHQKPVSEDRGRAAEALRQGEERFRLLMDEAKDFAIIMLGLEGHIIDWNAGAQRLTGYRAEEILGENCSRFHVPEDVETGKPAWELRLAAATGRAEDEGWRVRQDGSRFWADVVTTALHDQSGKLVGFSYLVRDFTERKQAEEALRADEERLRALAKTANDAIISGDAAGNITQFNPAAERIFGHAESEVLGRPLTLLVPARLRAECDSKRQQWLASGETGLTRKTVEITGLRKDGTEFPLELTTSSWRSAAGVFLNSILRDITERKQVEAQLQQTLSLLSTALESTADGLLVVDLAGNVVSHTRKFAAMWRIPEDLLATRDDSKLLDFVLVQLADPEAFLRQVRALMNHPEAESQDELRFKDGRVFERNSQPHRVGDQIVGRVWSFRDVTGRKQTEDAWRLAREHLDQYAHELENRVAERTASLEATVRSLERVLYHVAHDLRAPVRAVSGFTQLLTQTQASRLNAEGRNYAERIAAAAIHMDRLIQDLLAYGRLGHLRPVISQVELVMSIDFVLLQMAGEIAAKNAGVRVDRPLPAVRADPALLKLVLAHLLQNALTYVAPQVAPRVRLWAEPRDARARLWVEDNGIGIDPAYYERIFRVFERLHPAGEYSGTGIGLAIVAKAMERMDGSAGVEPNPAGGSRFWLEFERAMRE